WLCTVLTSRRRTPAADGAPNWSLASMIHLAVARLPNAANGLSFLSHIGLCIALKVFRHPSSIDILMYARKPPQMPSDGFLRFVSLTTFPTIRALAHQSPVSRTISLLFAKRLRQFRRIG